MSEYRRLADNYERAAYTRGILLEHPVLDRDATRAALDAYVERLHATIEAERAVLWGKTLLDSDHAREALAALDELPHLRAENARLAADAAFYRLTVQQRDAAWREIERLAADAERLDWLEAQAQLRECMPLGWTPAGSEFYDGSGEFVQWPATYWCGDEAQEGQPFTTLRAAIDAARQEAMT
jgi:hypothetical protein